MALISFLCRCAVKQSIDQSINHTLDLTMYCVQGEQIQIQYLLFTFTCIMLGRALHFNYDITHLLLFTSLTTQSRNHAT